MASRAGRLAALPGVQGQVDDVAGRIYRAARSLAAGHGGLPGDIHIRRIGSYDVDVVMEHEAALAIEVGHIDKVFGSGWVPGLHIMRDASRLAK